MSKAAKVAAKLEIRDVSPLLQILRNICLGRKHTLALRFGPLIATRSPPPPELPDGPAHKLNSNYYFTRDVRREVAPPQELESQSRIGEGKKLITPGKVYRWD